MYRKPRDSLQANSLKVFLDLNLFKPEILYVVGNLYLLRGESRFSVLFINCKHTMWKSVSIWVVTPHIRAGFSYLTIIHIVQILFRNISPPNFNTVPILWHYTYECPRKDSSKSLILLLQFIVLNIITSFYYQSEGYYH